MVPIATPGFAPVFLASPLDYTYVELFKPLQFPQTAVEGVLALTRGALSEFVVQKFIFLIKIVAKALHDQPVCSVSALSGQFQS